METLLLFNQLEDTIFSMAFTPYPKLCTPHAPCAFVSCQKQSKCTPFSTLRLTFYRTSSLKAELEQVRGLRIEREGVEEEELHGRRLQQEEVVRRARELAEVCGAPRQGR